jgi:hypothetical protein
MIGTLIFKAEDKISRLVPQMQELRFLFWRNLSIVFARSRVPNETLRIVEFEIEVSRHNL